MDHAWRSELMYSGEIKKKYCLCNDTYDSSTLLKDNPPFFANDNKKYLLSLHHNQEPYDGRITYARWSEIPLPQQHNEQMRSKTQLEMKEDIFTYEPHEDPMIVEWHLNFADKRLFFAYSGP